MKEKCLFPDLDLRAGHKCPRCDGPVHVFCGVEHPECPDVHLNVTCINCMNELDLLRMSPESYMTDAQQDSTTDSREDEPLIMEKPKGKKKAPPQRRRGALQPRNTIKQPS